MSEWNPKISMVGTVIFTVLIVIFVIQGLPGLVTDGAVRLATGVILYTTVVAFMCMMGIKLIAMYKQDVTSGPKRRVTPVKRLPRKE
jgi:hypothetical protein